MRDGISIFSLQRCFFFFFLQLPITNTYFTLLPDKEVGMSYGKYYLRKNLFLEST